MSTADTSQVPNTTPDGPIDPVHDGSGLYGSPVFVGLIVTQLLGAFNDNYFKQMVLLKCTDLADGGGANLQPLALAAFALPFVLLSGVSGFLSDRYSKRWLMIGCKVLEIVVMAASLIALLAGSTSTSQLQLLIIVLAFMGLQSTVFGPAKYGILPELYRGRTLVPVNGAIQMTTFLAIIFGTAAAGIALDQLNDSLWMCSTVAIAIAIFGTATSFLIRRTPVAQPDLEFSLDGLFVPRTVRQCFREQPRLLAALCVMALFWFVGGIAQPAVNDLGKLTLNLNDTRTSLAAASIGFGIAVGCVVAGVNGSRPGADRNTWVRIGSKLIVVALILICLVGSGVFGAPTQSKGIKEPLIDSLIRADGIEWLLRFSMFFLGFAAGTFVIPIQVYIQETPPSEIKGRMIGSMNLMSWTAILLSAGFLFAMHKLIEVFSPAGRTNEFHFATFGVLGLFMLPVALLYRLPETETTEAAGSQ